MDWASSQWKEGLSSIALQKISALEEKIEKLQKERQQKQHQFDCLELTLNKEKRKVGEEKQQTVRLERELQSLSDACKSFESKQQKFLADIQNRDSRINNLESQLSQAKKQNSRLQQLENDIEELRCLKESAKLETRQLEEKLIKEQDTIVKQSDAISDLEQTVRSLQEKCSNTENSVLLNVTDKENINILNISSKDNLASESLRKKVLEQENTIKSLQEELTRLSGSKEKVSISINDSFVTPVKGKNTSRDIPISSAKKSFSLWDNFGSTPAKSGKLTRHISDSSSFDNESDEKVHSLQLKLKQMCQELECQRHNFEATKNVMEQKFKEKENALKSEVKQQSLTIFDLDKELKELKNKYQQDVVQGSKKLDIVNMQLQKNELSKQQMEKDLKALEIQMNSRNSSLLQKEEELKDVLKLKNSLEATTKSLQSEKRELEKNCATLVSQKNSLSEEIRDLKVHLDGSSNLVKEKESVISNMKKEQSSFLKIKSDLENKINSLNKDLSSLQSEKSVFEKQLQELYAEISVMANNLESVKEEKKTMSSTLDFEKSKSEKLKSDLDNKEKELITLQSEIKSNELNIMSLKTELEQLTGDYNVKIKDMEQKLFTSNEEISHLKNEVQTHSDNKKILEENITELRKENVRISDLFTSKESECESFRKQIENLDSELQSVQSDNTTKHENICLLEEKIKSIDEAYNKQLIELKDTLCILKSEKADFEALLKDYKINEESLKATIAKAETKEKDLSELLAVEKEKNKELDSEFQNLQMELNSKYKELTELKDTICLLKSEKADFEILLKDYNTNEESLKASIAKTETEKHNLSELLTAEVEKKKELDTELSDLKVTVQNLQMELNSKASNISDMNESLCAIKSEKSALEKDLKNLADKEKTLENNLIQIETDKQNLLDLLNKEKVKSETLQLSVTELENKISDQQEELTAKDSSVSDLSKHIEELKANIHELNERLCATKSEKSAFENDLKNLAEKAKTLENNLIQLETDKQNLLDLLNKEKVKSETLQFSLVELEKKISDQQEELTAKDLSVSDLNKYVEELKANIHELNESLCAVNSEKSALENDLKNLAEKEKTLENYLVQAKTDKQNLLDLLSKEKVKSETLEFSPVELEKKIRDQQEELIAKDLSVNDLNKHIEELKANILELNESLYAVKSEKFALENDLQNLAVKEKTLENNLIQIETDKQKLSDLLNGEKVKSETLQFSLLEFEKKISDQQKELTAKDLTISDLNKHTEELKENMSEMNETVSSIKSETELLQKNLKACAVSEESLQKKLLQSEKERKKISELLSGEEEKCRLYEMSISDMEKKLNNLQTELDAKDSVIGELNKNIDEFKVKTCEIIENIDVIKSEKISLQKNLENCLKTEEELQKSLKQAEAEKQNMLELLNTEQKQTEKFQLEITELKNQINDMEEHFKVKDLTILDLTERIECHKAKLSDMDEIISTVNSEKTCLENSLKDCALREKSLQNDLQVFESDKQNLSEQLTAEKERSEELHLLVSELSKKVDNQQADLNLKETTIDDQNKNTEELKIKVCNLTEDIASLKSERLVVENELNEMTLKMESLKKNLLQMESEKDRIDEQLTAEKSKSETLELSLAETKLKLDSFHDELDSKNMNMELINKKLEELKHNEDHLQNLESQLVVFREKEISLNEKINQLEEEKTVSFESLSIERNKNLVLEANISEFQVKVANLESELKTTNENFSSITSDIAHSKETYELKLREFETALEVMKSQNDNLSNQIKDFIETETALKETMKMIEAEKETMSENLLCEIKKAEELKANLSTRESEICNRDKIICNLKTEIEDLRRMYEEEKHNLVIHIGDIKYNLLSMQDSVKSIYSENDRIQSDMNNLKQECQELLTQKACAQQSKEEFLFSLLNQLGVIEKHVEALEENYEENISFLKTALSNAELKIALQAEDYVILINEKDQLQNELISNQENICKKDMELKRAVILEDEHLKCLKDIEDLKETQEHLFQENYQLQSQISDLTQKMEEISLIADEQVEEIGMLKNEKSKLLEELKTTQDLLQERETELADVTLLVKEHINCSKDVENLMEAKESLTQENYQLLAQISDLTQKMEEISLIVDERVEEIGILKNEKSKLLEELKTTQDLLQEKETELADVSLLVKEHINCSETVKNLMEAKESLTQENHQLLKQVSNLQVDLSKAELKIVNQNKECGIHLEERSNLLNELKMLQEQLCDKETALKNAILIENEHTNCHKIVENLVNANKVLTEKNDQLQEQICDLKKILAEADSKTSIKNEELDILTEEKISLLEELKIIKENLCLKEKDCDNLTARKINLCQENTKLLTEISSVSQDLHIAKERLSFLDNKLKSILLKCKDVLSSVKDHGGQKDEISLDLMNTMSSYGLIENKVMTQGQQMENMCDLVCRCLELLKEYIFVQSSKLEIPIQVAEIGNQYFQGKDVETSNNYSMHYDGDVNHFPTDCQNLQTNIAKDLTALSTDVYTLICSFEERVLNQKDNFKFLMHHQLVECTDFQKMLLILKFMKNVYSKVSHRKFALQELKDIKICLLSQNQLPPKMASVLNSFSSDFKEDNDVNLFFEKFLLINAYKNIYMAHRLKKALYFVKDQLNMYSERFEKHERYLITYQNIHKHPSHMPILTQLKYKIYLNGLSSLGCREKLNGEISCLNINREQLFSINSILCNVKASTVPLILNCMFEFYENNCSSSVYKNLVHLIMKVLQSCCLKEVSFLSSNTIKTVDDFLLLVSSQNSSAFKNVVIRNQMRALGDLISSLLGDLSSIKHLAFSGEQELQKNRNVLSEISDQLNKLKFDHECKQRDLDLLRALLQEEKDRQQNLPTLTKTDCDVLLSQKEKLEQTVLEISKLCSVLKNIFSENCNVLNLQTEIATLSDTFCLCQTCLNTLEKAEEGQCNHVLFSPVTLIHFIAELFNSKSDLEKEVMKLEECKSAIKHDIMQLENDKSLLQHTIDDLEGNISTLEHELSNFKSKYSVLENEYQNINSLYIESNKEKEDQQNCLKANMEEIRNCKRQYEGLLTECQKMKNDLMEKEEEILNYEKNIQNKASQYETLDIKCKSYESEIENLNATITKLTDMKQKESGEINNSLVKEMKNKIASLEKSNNLLNMTVETVEEELQTVYEEKQNIQKDLQEKLDEVENLQQEIASWKNKIAGENNEVSCLKHTIQNLTKEVEDTVAKCTELLNKNSKLQSDVTLLEQNIKTYEKCIVEKDSSLEENIRIVNKLREEILIITNEKKNIQIKIEETEANLHLELQKKNTLLYDFEKKLNQILNEKADLEKQISCLLLSEEERKKLLLEKESSGLKIKELIEEIGLLRSKLENFELQAIFDKKEKEKAFQTIQNINFENEEYTKKLEKLKNELSAVKESNIESSVLIQQLQKELDSLKECKSTQLAKGSTLSDISQDHSSTECKCKGNCSVSELTVTKSEHDYKQYVTKIINVFITVLQDTEYGDDNHKTDLISMLSKWESNIINPRHFSEIKVKLQSVLDFQFGKLQELESELYNLKNLICKLTTELKQYCEGAEQKVKCNINLLGNKSCFEESLCVSPAKYQTYFVLNSYIGDLRSSFNMLELCFKSMKNIIINKDLEINSLKERCQDKVKDEIKTMQNEQKDDYLIMKNKCKLLISNAYRLEKDYNKLKQTNEELENRIKILEQEKLELNEEADEMAEIIKQQNYSEELENLYRKVAETSDELCELKEKNKCLRAMLEQYEDAFKEHGINISSAQNLAQDANALQ